jgi:hypothetical protein
MHYRLHHCRLTVAGADSLLWLWNADKAPTMKLESPSRSPLHFRAWVNYFTHIVHPSAATVSDRAPRPVTRRQQLLQAQELKRRAQREHMLELLREVKDRHRPHA